jgi:hypothetical protein
MAWRSIWILNLAEGSQEICRSKTCLGPLYRRPLWWTIIEDSSTVTSHHRVWPSLRHHEDLTDLAVEPAGVPAERP